MGRKKLTVEQVDQFRTALLDAALELFVEVGYEAVSIRALAAAVGCSAMTPYRYFDDKAAIFDACRCRAFENFADIQESTAAKHPQPMERIRFLGQAYATYANDNPGAFRLMFELNQSEKSSRALRKAEQRAFDTLRQSVTEGVEQDFIRGDADTLAHLYWAALHGIVVLQATGKLVHGRSKNTLLKALFGGVFTSAGV